MFEKRGLKQTQIQRESIESQFFLILNKTSMFLVLTNKSITSRARTRVLTSQLAEYINILTYE